MHRLHHCPICHSWTNSNTNKMLHLLLCYILTNWDMHQTMIHWNAAYIWTFWFGGMHDFGVEKGLFVNMLFLPHHDIWMVAWNWFSISWIWWKSIDINWSSPWRRWISASWLFIGRWWLSSFFATFLDQWWIFWCRARANRSSWHFVEKFFHFQLKNTINFLFWFVIFNKSLNSPII